MTIFCGGNLKQEISPRKGTRQPEVPSSQRQGLASGQQTILGKMPQAAFSPNSGVKDPPKADGHATTEFGLGRTRLASSTPLG